MYCANPLAVPGQVFDQLLAPAKALRDIGLQARDGIDRKIQNVRGH